MQSYSKILPFWEHNNTLIAWVTISSTSFTAKEKLGLQEKKLIPPFSEDQKNAHPLTVQSERLVSIQ